MKRLSYFSPRGEAGNFELPAQKGVTLVELLIVIGVIGVLTVVVVSSINPVTQFKKGRDTRRKADIAQIQAALEFYRTDQGYYPTSTPTSPFATCGGAFSFGATTYLPKIPCDPVGTNVYYVYTASPAACTNSPPNYCTTYTLVACLEIITDQTADGVDGSLADICPLPGGSPVNGRVSITVRNP